MSQRTWTNMPVAAAAFAAAWGALAFTAAAAEEPSDVERTSAVRYAPATAPAPAPTLTPTTRPVASRRMLWDRVRTQSELARREAEAQRALREAEGRHAAGSEDENVTKALLQARAALAQVQLAKAQAKEQDRLDVGSGLALEQAAYLGVATSAVPPVLGRQLKLADGVGLLVDYVEPASPAEEGGLQAYDVALRLNDQILINPQQLAVLVRTFDPGAEIKLTVVREAKETVLTVKLAKRAVKPLRSVVFGNVLVQRSGGEGSDSDDLDPVSAPPAAAASPLEAVQLPALRCQPGDAVKVMVSSVEGPGLMTTTTSKVSKGGEINVPYLEKPVRATGLTEVALRKVIADAYRAQGVDHDDLIVSLVGNPDEAANSPHALGGPMEKTKTRTK